MYVMGSEAEFRKISEEIRGCNLRPNGSNTNDGTPTYKSLSPTTISKICSGDMKDKDHKLHSACNKVQSEDLKVIGKLCSVDLLTPKEKKAIITELKDSFCQSKELGNYTLSSNSDGCSSSNGKVGFKEGEGPEPKDGHIERYLADNNFSSSDSNCISKQEQKELERKNEDWEKYAAYIQGIATQQDKAKLIAEGGNVNFGYCNSRSNSRINEKGYGQEGRDLASEVMQGFMVKEQ
jgi:hypothetical protein